MIELKKDLWDKEFDGNWRCITTNTTTNLRDEAIMGRGCAKEASEKYPWLRKEYGKKIKTRGDVVVFFNKDKLIMFPVKKSPYEIASIEMIKRSCSMLNVWFIDEFITEKIIIPRPGCGAGMLDWNEVKPIIEEFTNYIGDNLIVVSK